MDRLQELERDNAALRGQLLEARYREAVAGLCVKHGGASPEFVGPLLKGNGPVSINDRGELLIGEKPLAVAFGELARSEQHRNLFDPGFAAFMSGAVPKAETKPAAQQPPADERRVVTKADLLSGRVSTADILSGKVKIQAD